MSSNFSNDVRSLDLNVQVKKKWLLLLLDRADTSSARPLRTDNTRWIFSRCVWMLVQGQSLPCAHYLLSFKWTNWSYGQTLEGNSNWYQLLCLFFFVSVWRLSRPAVPELFFSSTHTDGAVLPQGSHSSLNPSQKHYIYYDSWFCTCKSRVNCKCLCSVSVDFLNPPLEFAIPCPLIPVELSSSNVLDLLKETWTFLFLRNFG